MPKTRRNIAFDKSMWQQLEQRKRDTGVPIAELIRRAIDEYLKRNKK